MFGLYANTGKSFNSGGTLKELKRAKVIDKQSAPLRGYKRVLVKEEAFCADMAAIDVPVKAAEKIEKSKTYDFEVEKRGHANFGLQTYICDDTPLISDGTSKFGKRDFGSRSDKKFGKTQFSRF